METALIHPGIATKEKNAADHVDSVQRTKEKTVGLKPSSFEVQNDKAKVKELQRAIESSTNGEKAEFTRDTLQFFQNMGIDAGKVDPVPLGVGANHAVYKYITPNNTQRVIKLTRPGGSISTMNKGISEEENIHDVQTYYGTYFPKTEFKEDKKVGIACQIQDVVEGEPITDKNYTSGIKKQLMEIGQMNKRAYKEKGIALDFVGMHGILRWLKKQVSKLVFHRGTAEIANVLVDKQGKVKIIDTDFYRFNDPRQSFKERIFARVAHTFTQIFVKHYFDVSV